MRPFWGAAPFLRHTPYHIMRFCFSSSNALVGLHRPSAWALRRALDAARADAVQMPRVLEERPGSDILVEVGGGFGRLGWWEVCGVWGVGSLETMSHTLAFRPWIVAVGSKLSKWFRLPLAPKNMGQVDVFMVQAILLLLCAEI